LLHKKRHEQGKEREREERPDQTKFFIALMNKKNQTEENLQVIIKTNHEITQCNLKWASRSLYGLFFIQIWLLFFGVLSFIIVCSMLFMVGRTFSSYVVNCRLKFEDCAGEGFGGSDGEGRFVD
jgi:hypothetical protein